MRDDETSAGTVSEAKPFPLSQAAPDSLVRVVRISRDIQCRQRLLGMGIAPGTLIRVDRTGSGGSLVLEIEGKKFILSDGLPCQVTVDLVATVGHL